MYSSTINLNNYFLYKSVKCIILTFNIQMFLTFNDFYVCRSFLLAVTGLTMQRMYSNVLLIYLDFEDIEKMVLLLQV